MMSLRVAKATIVILFGSSILALKCGSDVECPLYSKCDVYGDSCACPRTEDSEKIYKPVCGSNGFTYNNEMQLKDYSCSNNLNILIVHHGKCPQQYSCDSPMCHPESICNTTTGKCQCPQYDVSVKNIVCGTDGKEYNSKEELLFSACVKGSGLKIASYSSCSLRSPDTNGKNTEEPISLVAIVISVVIGVVVVVILAMLVWLCYQRRIKSKFTVSRRNENEFLTYKEPITSI